MGGGSADTAACSARELSQKMSQRGVAWFLSWACEGGGCGRRVGGRGRNMQHAISLRSVRFACGGVSVCRALLAAAGRA